MVSALSNAFSRISQHRQFGLLSTLFIVLLGGVIRLGNLANPKSLVFDETYYVKDAYTLGKFGSERTWPESANQFFESGTPDVFESTGSYVVHPPLGKWIIWLGLNLFGVENSFGWRFSTAVLGTISIALIIAIARQLTKSNAFSAIAGFLFAIEGHAVVLSRTAILDGILTFFVLLSFFVLLKADRAWKERLKRHQTLAVQPWLILLGIIMGMAGSVKWSAIYFLVTFGLFTFWSDWKTRAKFGLSKAAALGQGLVNALTLAVSSFSIYLLSWLGWLADPQAWGRNAEANWWESLFSYHVQILDFHTNLDSEHPYQANAWQWLLNLRPTAFYFEQFEGTESCGLLSSCTVAITAIPNLVVWFAGLVAMLWLIKNRLRKPQSQLVVLGFLAGWLPWIFFLDRTAFQFYAVVISPFFVLALTLVLQHYWQRGLLLKVRAVRERRITWLVLLASAVAVFYLPIWMGLPVPYEYWRLQMLLPIWI
ncbi:MAG: phospholipid carrier-dependent glycosyltransferase [Actinobacteria bacterium]|nr:phospholipid carrier-dependent glycosyltransferase [Actinomycetota bacterium]